MNAGYFYVASASLNKQFKRN